LSGCWIARRSALTTAVLLSVTTSCLYPSERLNQVAFSPDGKLLATSG
jgi:hypothetical protein